MKTSCCKYIVIHRASKNIKKLYINKIVDLFIVRVT